MKENKGMIFAALAAGLPALILAGSQWIEANAAERKAAAAKAAVEVQRDKKQALADNYGEYVEDRMNRDAALERALMNCMALLPARPPAEAATGMAGMVGGLGEAFAEEEAPAPDLDDIAEEFGYEQQVAP